MRNQIQDKLKIKLDISKVYNEMYIFQEKRTILLMGHTLISDKQVNNAELIIKKLIKFCIDNNYEHVAICIDMHDARDCFTFKALIRENAEKTNITIVLNKIIEITKQEDINDILKAFHDNSIMGHLGKHRTLASIKQWF